MSVSLVDPRVHAAVLRCVGRWGTAKTTLDDIAREAGVSRATVYRLARGGREALIASVGAAELAHLLGGLRAAIEQAGTLEDAVVAAVTTAGQFLVTHPALQYLLEHEPELVLPHLSFRGFDQLLAVVTGALAPVLERLTDGDVELAERVVEWVTRLSVSYLMSPSPRVDLADESSVRSLVQGFVLPGIVPHLNRRTA